MICEQNVATDSYGSVLTTWREGMMTRQMEKTADGSMPSICIVSHNAYGMISQKSYEKPAVGACGPIGGIEWQSTLLARWLVGRGFAVSMLTYDEGGPAEEVLQGVRVLKVCPSDAGFSGLRFFHPKWTGLNRAMRLADADVYYQNGAECVTGQVALWCRRRARAFVFSVASDGDCESNPPFMRNAVERVLYRYGIRRADCRLAQTDRQCERLKRSLGCDAVRIPMPCPGPSSWEPRSCPPPEQFRVLWVAGVRRVKRPHLLLELARRCPDLSFDMVGPFYQENYARSIRQEAGAIPNLYLHGAQPRGRLDEFYRAAGCLCCTSEYEGFPNTFLEAWSHGLPVVSTFDPDGLIRCEALGCHADGIDALVEALRRLRASDAEYRQASSNARQYYLRHHTPENVMPRFEEAFRVAAKRSRS